jgi:putative chitinase
MEVTADLLAKLAPGLASDRAGLFAGVITAVLPMAGIATRLSLSHFLGQVMVETGGLRRLVESTAYKDPVRLDRMFSAVKGVDHARQLIAQGPEAIANTIYAGRLGNGPPASGDGSRYRGRGLLQLTGRGNYRLVGQLIGRPLEEQPETIGEPVPAAETAALFWKARNINAPANANNLDEVTRLVNGPARVHMAERGQFQVRALALLGG